MVPHFSPKPPSPLSTEYVFFVRSFSPIVCLIKNVSCAIFVFMSVFEKMLLMFRLSSFQFVDVLMLTKRKATPAS